MSAGSTVNTIAAPARRRGTGPSALEVIVSEDGAVTLLEPFRIAVPDADLVDLRRRLSAARWPSRETVSDWSQGVPLDVLRQLCEHWRTAYDSAARCPARTAIESC
jgi:Epoxide hydrolase N terminus